MPKTTGQDVRVAEINREKQIKLAEAEKERESGVAVQEAEKAWKYYRCRSYKTLRKQSNCINRAECFFKK